MPRQPGEGTDHDQATQAALNAAGIAQKASKEIRQHDKGQDQTCPKHQNCH